MEERIMSEDELEEKKQWLYDLTHGYIHGMDVVRGFIKFYALHGREISHVAQDVIFRTIYGAERAKKAEETLKEELKKFADGGI